MIVDVHSHFFTYPAHFTPDFVRQAARARNGVEVDLTVRWKEYEATAKDRRWTIVFGGKRSSPESGYRTTKLRRTSASTRIV